MSNDENSKWLPEGWKSATTDKGDGFISPSGTLYAIPERAAVAGLITKFVKNFRAVLHDALDETGTIFGLWFKFYTQTAEGLRTEENREHAERQLGFMLQTLLGILRHDVTWSDVPAEDWPDCVKESITNPKARD